MPEPTFAETRVARTRGDDPLRVLVLTGSVREGRFGPVPARWITRQADSRPGIEAELVDLADVRLPMEMPMSDENVPQAANWLGAKLDSADAVVVVTPVYNRGYPAPLKNAIDWFHHEWAAKPVGFVSYGGRTGGVEAVEQLRTVFIELKAMTIRNVLSFPDYWDAFTDTGEPVDRPRSEAAAEDFLTQVTWWGRALRAARQVTS